MAIESLNSTMIYPTQQVQKVTPVNEKKQSDVSEGTSRENVAVSEGKIAPSTVVDEKNEGLMNENKEQQATNEQIRKAVEQFNKKAKNSEVQFGIHEATHRVTIKIIDKDTKETIKELPPEKTLDMIAKAWELAGILVDEKR